MKNKTRPMITWNYAGMEILGNSFSLANLTRYKSITLQNREATALVSLQSLGPLASMPIHRSPDPDTVTQTEDPQLSGPVINSCCTAAFYLYLYSICFQENNALRKATEAIFPGRLTSLKNRSRPPVTFSYESVPSFSLEELSEMIAISSLNVWDNSPVKPTRPAMFCRKVLSYSLNIKVI